MLGRTEVQELQKKIVDHMSELIVTSGEIDDVLCLKNKIYKNIDELGSKHINYKDKNGKTLLNYTHELDSQDEDRLYNSNLVKIGEYIKSYGGKAAEINVQEVKLREHRRRNSLCDSWCYCLLMLFLIGFICITFIFLDIDLISYINGVTTNIANVTIQRSGMNQSVEFTIEDQYIPNK